MAANYGLLGEHLSHSYSKPIHEALADYTYDLIELTKEELKEYANSGEIVDVLNQVPVTKGDSFFMELRWFYKTEKRSARCSR